MDIFNSIKFIGFNFCFNIFILVVWYNKIVLFFLFIGLVNFFIYLNKIDLLLINFKFEVNFIKLDKNMNKMVIVICMFGVFFKCEYFFNVIFNCMEEVYCWNVSVGVSQENVIMIDFIYVFFFNVVNIIFNVMKNFIVFYFYCICYMIYKIKYGFVLNVIFFNRLFYYIFFLMNDIYYWYLEINMIVKNVIESIFIFVLYFNILLNFNGNIIGNVILNIIYCLLNFMLYL